jgi:hypothetical protein
MASIYENQAVDPGRLPNANEVAGMPRKERKSARTIAQYWLEQYRQAMWMRRPHAINWIKVCSIMAGYHYFAIRHGRWVLLPKKSRQVRAIVPVMNTKYRWELGRISSNQIGVTGAPITGRSANAFELAERAQDIMTGWIDETDQQKIFVQGCEQMLFFGGFGLYRYSDPFRKQVYLKPFPFSELFPIPWDARNWQECDGIQRVALVTRQWLELQDELFRRKYGKKPEKPLASFADQQSTRFTTQYAGFGSSYEIAGRVDGAVCHWVWMKPTELNPFGEYAMMLGDELVRYKSGRDEDGGLIALPDGTIPIEPIMYTKKPDDFFPKGFLEELVPMQMEANRQMTTIIEGARYNRPFIGYAEGRVDPKDVQDSPIGLIPIREAAMSNTKEQALFSVNATPQNREVGQVLSIVKEWAQEAAAHDSSILYGEQSGRTEGGPATQLLNTNAQAPLQPVMQSIEVAYRNTFPKVLDGLHGVWPDNKIVRLTGPQNVGREIRISRDQLPWSQDVILAPTPMLSGGKGSVAQLLFQLRSMPTKDGGFELESNEFRRGLHMLGMSPPGVTIFDKAEQRIRFRIGQILKGQAPPLVNEQVRRVQMMEDHELAVRLMKEVALDPGFAGNPPQVQQTLLDEIDFHMNTMPGARPPDNFADQMELADQDQTDDWLETAENDPLTPEGQMAIDGQLIGV